MAASDANPRWAMGLPMIRQCSAIVAMTMKSSGDRAAAAGRAGCRHARRARAPGRHAVWRAPNAPSRHRPNWPAMPPRSSMRCVRPAQRTDEARMHQLQRKRHRRRSTPLPAPAPKDATTLRSWAASAATAGGTYRHAVRGGARRRALQRPDLVVAAEKAGLEFGDMGIYHRLVDGKRELGSDLQRGQHAQARQLRSGPAGRVAHARRELLHDACPVRCRRSMHGMRCCPPRSDWLSCWTVMCSTKSATRSAASASRISAINCVAGTAITKATALPGAMQDLNDLYFFAAVVEHGGFSSAGRALGVPKSRLSKRIAQLEERLGVRLLQRTTRRFVVTEVGERFYGHCRAVLEEAQAAQDAVEELRAEPRGVVRLSCPVSLAQTVLAHICRSSWRCIRKCRCGCCQQPPRRRDQRRVRHRHPRAQQARYRCQHDRAQLQPVARAAGGQSVFARDARLSQASGRSGAVARACPCKSTKAHRSGS
jgi:hypothetical protein